MIVSKNTFLKIGIGKKENYSMAFFEADFLVRILKMYTKYK